MPKQPKDGARRSGAPFRLYLTFFAGWVFAAAFTLRGAYSGESDTRSRLLAWFFVAGTGVLVAALVDRDRAARRRTAQLLDERQALIESMGIVTDPRIMQLPLYQLLDDLLARARTVLSADAAAVYLLDTEKQVLERTATSGDETG